MFSQLDLVLGLFLEDRNERERYYSCYKNKTSSADYFNLPVKGVDVPIPKNIKRILSPILNPYSFNSFKKIYNEVIQLEQISPDKTYPIIKKIRNHSGHILTTLLESYLYLKVGNTARAENILSDMMGHDLLYHTFNSPLKEVDQKQVHLLFLDLLKRLKESSINKKILENVGIYFLEMTDERLKNQMISTLDLNTQMSSLRKKYQSFFYGYAYPFVWAPQIYENGSREEYYKFIKTSDIEKQINSKPDYLLFYRSLDNISEKESSLIFKVFKILQGRSDLYSKSIYFRLRADDQFNRILLSQSKLKTGLLINELRRFYLSQLKSDPKNIKFYLLQLMMLGDINASYFFELVRNERN